MKLEFGIMADKISVQLKGLFPDDELVKIDENVERATILWIHNLLTEGEYHKCLKRIAKGIDNMIKESNNAV